MSTPNRRVQKLLDTAADNGWTVEHPTPEIATWLLHPGTVPSDGFVVYGLPNDAAKVLHASTYKPVAQAEASKLMAQYAVKADAEADGEPSLEEVIQSALNLVREARNRGFVTDDNPLNGTGVEVRVLPADGSNDIAVVAEYVIPDALDATQKSDFCSGAILAATVISQMVDKSLNAVTGVLSENAPEALEGALVTPPNAAHAYLHLANQVRDPRTLGLIFMDNATPSEAATRGAQMVCKALVATWTSFADGLFAMGDGMAAPLAEFVSSLHEHAEYVRNSANETFGEFVTLSDADFEGLLS